MPWPVQVIRMVWVPDVGQAFEKMTYLGENVAARSRGDAMWWPSMATLAVPRSVPRAPIHAMPLPLNV